MAQRSGGNPHRLLIMTHLLHTALIVSSALLLDHWLGEPQRYHPLVGFGRWAAYIEDWLYAPQRLRGVMVLCLTLSLPVIATGLLSRLPEPWNDLFSVWTVYFAVGLRSLYDHTQPICEALDRHDDYAARLATARIVSRDHETLSVLPATCESILENGNDGVFAALFWFLLAGAPGVILYRLSNTLDATWGYKSPRYLAFGWAAARWDDVMNWVPARLTALTYSLLGHKRQALACWHSQAPLWDSPNAGPVMAAGAGTLNIKLGGPACYAGKWQIRPWLGVGSPPLRQDIDRSLSLVRQGTLLWVTIMLVIGGIVQSTVR